MTRLDPLELFFPHPSTHVIFPFLTPLAPPPLSPRRPGATMLSHDRFLTRPANSGVPLTMAPGPVSNMEILTALAAQGGELLIPKGGRRPTRYTLGAQRELGLDDITSLRNRELAPYEPPKLKRLRHKHHSVARLVAEGMEQKKIAAMTGYTPATIQHLERDPSFAELVAVYRAQLDAKYYAVHEHVAALGITAVEELQERLEDDPGSFTNRELKEIAESMLEHSGASAKSSHAPGLAPGTQHPPQLVVNFVTPAPQKPILDGVIEVTEVISDA